MSDVSGTRKLKDAEEVKQVMGKLAEKFAGDQSLVGVGALAIFASAIATLADEIEKLKHQTPPTFS